VVCAKGRGQSTRLSQSSNFDPDCRLCPRLADYRERLRRDFPDYFNGPVSAFGAAAPAVLIVGLAPGLHGANASGRPFTGDYAGVLLYRTLFEQGFADRPESLSADDGLALSALRITNAVKCVPPANKPTTAEANTCQRFLAAELAEQDSVRVIVALGAIAHRSVVRSVGGRLSDFPFAHGAEYALPDDRILVDSYHCSRYNTQTRRLTTAMFGAVIKRARRIADDRGHR